MRSVNLSLREEKKRREWSTHIRSENGWIVICVNYLNECTSWNFSKNLIGARLFSFKLAKWDPTTPSEMPAMDQTLDVLLKDSAFYLLSYLANYFMKKIFKKLAVVCGGGGRAFRPNSKVFNLL